MTLEFPGSEYTLRQATLSDLADLVRLRRGMFEAMGVTDTAALDASDAACDAYFRRAIPTGEHRGWVVETPDGHVVACGGYVVDAHPPGPGNLTGRIGYIMNLYVEPAHRRRGLARRIMTAILEYARADGVGLCALHATEMGRALYEDLGFAATNEMRRRW